MFQRTSSELTGISYVLFYISITQKETMSSLQDIKEQLTHKINQVPCAQSLQNSH